MFIRFACPQCRKMLKVGDKFAGKTSKCPGCASPVTVPAVSELPFDDFAAAPPAPNWNPAPVRPAADAFSPQAPALHHDGQSPEIPFDQLNDAPPLAAVPGNWRGVQGGLRMVRTGTLVQMTGLCIMLLMMFFAFFAGMQAVADVMTRPQGQIRSFGRVQPTPTRFGDEPASRSSENAWLVVGAVLLTWLAIGTCVVVGTIIRLIGLARCAGAPSESGAAGWAWGAFFAELAPYAITMLTCVLSIIHEALGRMASMLHIAAALAAAICFLLFLRQVGIALGSDQLRARVGNFVLWWVSCICLMMLVGCLGGFSLVAIGVGSASMDGPPDFATIGSAVAIVFGTMILCQLCLSGAILVKYLGLVQFAADEVRRRAAHLRTT